MVMVEPCWYLPDIIGHFSIAYSVEYRGLPMICIGVGGVSDADCSTRLAMHGIYIPMGHPS